MAVKEKYSYPEEIIIGTRGSPLALAQANMVKSELANIGYNSVVTLKIIKTSGDWNPSDGEVRLEALAGGKAQFAKEIEDALLSRKIDIAVHSMKDMETNLPEGLSIPFILPRADARDVFLSNDSQKLNMLSQAATIGTASVRRQAALLHQFPSLSIVPFRGNVQTRIDKMKAGQVDGTFLACAGLNRLGISCDPYEILEPEEMLPAAGQGAIGIEIRRADLKGLAFLSQLNCSETYLCVSCERAVLHALGGGCRAPIAVYAQYDGHEIYLRALVFSRDIRQKTPSLQDAVKLGKSIGAQLKSEIPEGILI